MDIKSFVKPEEHPGGICRGYDNAYEKESVLAFILSQCVEAGGFGPVETKYAHPTMVSDGLLEEVSERRYKLTKKSIGLLYGVYGA